MFGSICAILIVIIFLFMLHRSGCRCSWRSVLGFCLIGYVLYHELFRVLPGEYLKWMNLGGFALIYWDVRRIVVTARNQSKST
jgi:hypothetical protein